VVVAVVLIAVVVAALVLVHAAAAFFLAETLTRTKRWRVQGDPRDVRLRHEEVAFAAADGLGLRGWYLESPGARATIVLVHDAEGTRSDPTLGLLELQRDYVRRGLHVLSFDLRGRGESAGGRDQLGAAEIADVIGAVAYARRRNDGAPVILHGFGMGASMSLVAASRQQPVAAVIADSPVLSMRAYLRGLHPRMPRHVFALAAIFARRLYGADLDAISPLRAMPYLVDTPVLFVHGEEDAHVPVEHTLNLAAASLNALDEIWRVPGVGHDGAYRGDPVVYVARCLDFIETAVPGRRPVVASAV
jgi:dipeptidyl aminopeptidase/acylaminoacyl peptidase